ncbi:MAG TPA: hypothetical protein VKX96_07590 [Chloroflexota bacterium]|jgi:hypothetical protein|nr:hypothetical protein [Chloroflexota bacterium]
MVLKALKVVILCLVVPALLAMPVFAQSFSSLVAQAAVLNQQWVNQLDTALNATTLSGVQAGATTAIATGKQIQALLNEALPLAPDDASRSRISGLLAHVNAALQDGQQAVQATNFDTARGDVNAMHGEAAEALNEFPTTMLPQSGGVPLKLPLLVGAWALFFGYSMRRRLSPMPLKS